MRRLLLVCLTSLLVAACGGTPAPESGAGDGGADPGEATVPEAPDATPTDGGVLAFTAPTLDGGQLDASSLEGRDVVLWFWAPW